MKPMTKNQLKEYKKYCKFLQWYIVNSNNPGSSYFNSVLVSKYVKNIN